MEACWSLAPVAPNAWRRRLFEPILQTLNAAPVRQEDAIQACSSTPATDRPNRDNREAVASRWLAPLALKGRRPWPDPELQALVPVHNEVSEDRFRPRIRPPRLTRMALARLGIAGSGLKAITYGGEAHCKDRTPRPHSPVTVAEALYTRDVLGKNLVIFRGSLRAEVDGRDLEFAEMASHRAERQRAVQQQCRKRAAHWKIERSREESLLELRWNLVANVSTERSEEALRMAIPTPEPVTPGAAKRVTVKPEVEVLATIETDAPVPEGQILAERKHFTTKPKRPLEQRTKNIANLRRNRAMVSVATQDKPSNRTALGLPGGDAGHYLRSVFLKYDKNDSGGLDPDELKGVLQDLGLKAKTDAEREAVRHILHKPTELEVSFDVFSMTLLPEVRAALAAVRKEHLTAVFRQADKDCSNSLSINEMVVALRGLNIIPTQDQVREAIQDIVPNAGRELFSSNGDLDLDANVVTLECFEALASYLNEVVERSRIQRTEDLCRLLGLSAEQQELWRDSLADINDVFHLYCDKLHETADCKALLSIVRDLCMLPWKAAKDLEPLVRCIAFPNGERALEFKQVIESLERLRQVRDEFLASVFAKFDEIAGGGLSMQEARNALQAAGVTPQNAEEAHELGHWLEEFDEGGSGHVDFRDFLRLASRIMVQLPKFRRTKERQLCYTYGLTDGEIDELRAVFISHDADMTDSLDAAELAAAVGHVRAEWALDDFSEALRRLNMKVQWPPQEGGRKTKGKTGVDFISFISLVKYHDNIKGQKQLCMLEGIDKSFTTYLCNVWWSLEPSILDNTVATFRLLDFVSHDKTMAAGDRQKRLLEQKLSNKLEEKHVSFDVFFHIMKESPK